MKTYLTYLILLMAFSIAGMSMAADKEETPDTLNITGSDQFPQQLEDAGPLSQLDRNLILSAYKGQLADVKMYIEKGADVNLQDQKERTPLIFAASEGHTPVVEYLIEAGADVSMRDKDGQTALLYASKRSFNETATSLLDRGADVNLQSSKRGVTALMLAAVWDNTELVKILLDRGADPHLTDSFGRTARMLAEKKGNTAVLGMLADPPVPESEQ